MDIALLIIAWNLYAKRVWWICHVLPRDDNRLVVVGDGLRMALFEQDGDRLKAIDIPDTAFKELTAGESYSVGVVEDMFKRMCDEASVDAMHARLDAVGVPR